MARAGLEYSEPRVLAHRSERAPRRPATHHIGRQRRSDQKVLRSRHAHGLATVGWVMSEAGGWRIKTEHITRFSYSDPAFASYNEVRVVPQSN